MKELSPINIYTILHPNTNSHILHTHMRRIHWFMGHKVSLKKCKGYENKACFLIIVELSKKKSFIFNKYSKISEQIFAVFWKNKEVYYISPLSGSVHKMRKILYKFIQNKLKGTIH